MMIIIVLLFFYDKFIAFTVSYEDIAVEDAPEAIREAIYIDPENTGYRVFHDDTHTYIYYKSSHEQNEYITTLLELKGKGGGIVATARVSYAQNDGYVSYEKLLKADRISGSDLTLEESIDVK